MAEWPCENSSLYRPVPYPRFLPASKGENHINHIVAVQRARLNAGEDLQFNELVEGTKGEREQANSTSEPGLRTASDRRAPVC